MGKMGDILISIVCHFLQWPLKLIAENIRVYILSLFVDNLSNTKFNIWNIILCSF